MEYYNVCQMLGCHNKPVTENNKYCYKHDTYSVPLCNECGSPLTSKEVEVCHEYKTDPFGKDAICSICWGEKATDNTKETLINKIENHYGGPKSWPLGCRPTDEDSHETLVTVYNAGIDDALNEVEEVL